MNVQRAVFLLVAAAATHVQAQLPVRNVPDAELERAYWSCLQLDEKGNAEGRRMDEATFTRCSVVSKEMQLRHFGGDFAKLHEWTQSRKVRAAQSRTSAD